MNVGCKVLLAGLSLITTKAAAAPTQEAGWVFNSGSELCVAKRESLETWWVITIRPDSRLSIMNTSKRGRWKADREVSAYLEGSNFRTEFNVTTVKYAWPGFSGLLPESAIDQFAREDHSVAISIPQLQIENLPISYPDVVARHLKACAENLERVSPAEYPVRWPTPVSTPSIDRNMLIQLFGARRVQALKPLLFRLFIDSTGKPTDCVVEETTGDDEIDRSLCGALANRMRFKPALNDSGKPVRGSYSTRVVI